MAPQINHLSSKQAHRIRPWEKRVWEGVLEQARNSGSCVLVPSQNYRLRTGVARQWLKARVHAIGPLSCYGCLKAETRQEREGGTSGRTVFAGITDTQLVSGSSGCRLEYKQFSAAQTAENRARPSQGPRTGWPEAHCRIQQA